MQNDLSCPFHELNDIQRIGLISQMMEIQKHKLDNEKSMNWYRNTVYLTCNQLPKYQYDVGTRSEEVVNTLRNTLVRQRCNDAIPMESVLSVSYTWEKSKFEEQKPLEFWITDRGQSTQEQSKVRGTVVSRILTYVEHSDVSGFWIDKDCIDQRDKVDEAIAIQSMDLIYRFSHHSVAFLTTPIRTTFQARLLSNLMLGKWTCLEDSIGRIKLKRFVRMQKAQAMISLLEHILSDPWWTRAWTYHEELCASINMMLLLPHYPHVDRAQGCNFGNISGEIRIPAVHFRIQVTKFCLAHMRKQGVRWQEGTARCKMLLAVAGQHRLINEFRKEEDRKFRTGALTWQIINDLKHRRLQNPWEILAIIANCCGYSVRLNATSLQALGCSLSAAVLTLLLLNGEILRNDHGPRLPMDVDLYDLLSRLSFRSFESMVDVKEYTYLKRCRFPDVSLSSGGILTSGCIWRLHGRYRVPPTQHLHNQEIDFQNPLLSEAEMEQLDVLCKHVGHDYPALTESIRRFTKQVRRNEARDRLASMVVMARNLIRSIQLGKILAIASFPGRSRCHGIFTAAEATNHCFTAWQPRMGSESLKADRYLEKFISLEVKIVPSRESVPQLSILRWVAGLCFFGSTDQHQVLLPWSACLQQLESCL